MYLFNFVIEICVLINFLFLDRQQNYESDTIQEYREQLKDFQIELTKKSEEIERLILNNEHTKKEMQEEVTKLLDNINQIKLEHKEEVQELERRWKHIVNQKTSQLETRHEHEIAELTNEWKNERKVSLFYFTKFLHLFFFNFYFYFCFYFPFFLQNDENTELLDKVITHLSLFFNVTILINSTLLLLQVHLFINNFVRTLVFHLRKIFVNIFAYINTTIT